MYFRFPLGLYLRLRRISHGVTLGVRAAIFDNQRYVFLLEHTYTAGWHFPGGGVDPGESAADAVERELGEEAGIALTGPADLFGIYVNARLSRRDHVAFYVCRHWRQDHRPKVPNMEIRACGFFPLDALPLGTTDATRQRLAEVLDGATRLATW